MKIIKWAVDVIPFFFFAGMSNSQRYPLNLCLIIDDGEIRVFPTKHCLQTLKRICCILLAHIVNSAQLTARISEILEFSLFNECFLRKNIFFH